MDTRERREPNGNHIELPEAVLLEMSLTRNRIGKMNKEERAKLFGKDPFRGLGFNDVRPINLVTAPDKESIEAAVGKQRKDLLAVLKISLSLPEDTRIAAIRSFLTLPIRRKHAIRLSELSRSVDADDRSKARRLIDQFQKDPEAAFLEIERPKTLVDG